MSSYERLQPLAASFLADSSPAAPLRTVLQAFADGKDLTRPAFDALVGSELASPSQKEPFLDFILYCIRDALNDHLLTEAELNLLRYLKRLFRVEEGEFLARRQPEVSEILLLQIERILEDRQVDSKEALHKVELQAIFDLGYDQFADIVRPKIHEVLLGLVNQIDPDQDGYVSPDELEWYHQQVLALDTVVHLVADDQTGGAAPGYLYVLANPSMDGLVKVGKTTRDPALRARELGAVTGVPTPFLLVYESFFPDCDKAEKLVHDTLEARGHRLSDDREFFSATPSEVIEVLLETKAQLAAV